jgi:cytochrome c
MKWTTLFGSVFLTANWLFLPPAFAEGDVAAGKNVFKRCAACHDATTDNNKVGPGLLSVVGRKAGSLASFQDKYSPAMIAAGAAGLVWDEASIADFLKMPKEKIPGNKMGFPALKKDADIANVIAYLKANPKP